MGEEVAVEGGRTQEFTEFMVSRWSTLVRFGYGLTGDLGLAEDLAQTALIRACAAWARVRQADDPDSYVRKIMINAHRSQLRRHRVHEQLTGSLPEPEAAATGAVAGDRPELLAALLSLPAGQRAVLVLRYWLDLSEAQTAASLGCSVGNVKSQAARALAKLRLDPALASQAGGGRSDRDRS